MKPTGELARDCNAPESLVSGSSDPFNSMCQALTAIPRDGDHNSTLLSTIDKDKTNIRQTVRLKLIPGYSMYLLSTAKNFLLDPKTEQRFKDLIIVCNVRCSSGPIDEAGLQGRIEGEADVFEQREACHDRGDLRTGIVSKSRNFRTKQKGSKPADRDQEMWAPFHYFSTWGAGVLVGFPNKLGWWTMRLDPGVEAVLTYLCKFAMASLTDFFSGDKVNNNSRYFDSFVHRQVAPLTALPQFSTQGT